MKKTATFVFLLSTLLLAFAAGAQADNTACGGAVFLVPDVSVHEGMATSGGNHWFQFVARANRSYLIQTENLSSTDLFATVGLFAPITPDCAGSAITTTGTLGNQIAPGSTNVGNTQGGVRRMFTASSDMPLFFRIVVAAGQQFRVRVEETTLFSPRWSTFGGFYTSWGIQNTTNAAINVTLRVIPSGSSTPLATATFSVDPGEVVFRDTRPSDLNLAANQAGNVVLTHDGPPGAIQADAFLVNESGAIVEAIPVKFEPARQQR